MYYNCFYTNELLSNPDKVVKELVRCVKKWNVDHTVVEGLGIQEVDIVDSAPFRMTYVPFSWRARLREDEIDKHKTIWSFWDPYPLTKTIFENEKESLNEECVKEHIQEMVYELQKIIKERYVTKKKDAIISASEQFEI